AFDVDLAALFQILSGDFRQPLPEHDVVPLGAVLPLSAFVFETFVGSDGKLGYRRALRRVFHFRVFAQIANQNDFIDAFSCHEYGSFHAGGEMILLTEAGRKLYQSRRLRRVMGSTEQGIWHLAISVWPSWDVLLTAKCQVPIAKRWVIITTHVHTCSRDGARRTQARATEIGRASC